MRVLVLVLFCVAALALAQRTLVLVDDLNVKTTHSVFFKHLQDRGHKLSFFVADDPAVVLEQYGDFMYDNVIFFAPSVEDVGKLTPDTITKFIENGGNLLLAGGKEIHEPVRTMAEQCGVDFDEEDSEVIDHFNHAGDDHSMVKTANFFKSPLVVGRLAGEVESRPVLFRGIGQSVDPDNTLALTILTASDTAYSAVPDEAIKGAPQNTGRDVVLVTGIQARNNARVTVVGSVDMFSDAFATAESSNEVFCDELSKWAFKERGVLRYRNVHHGRTNGEEAEHQLGHHEGRDLPKNMFPDPEIARDSLVYRIKDELEFNVEIEELVDGAWRPFNARDVQLEFVMLNPYVRKNLVPDGNGKFTAVFKAPDVYGIYRFRIMYRRPGYTTLELSRQVSVRPFRHNEFERFIETAFPYYASTLSIVIGFFVFCVVFLLSR